MGILQYETSGSLLRMITAASYRLDDKALVSTETLMLPEPFGAIVSFFLSKVIQRRHGDGSPVTCPRISRLAFVPKSARSRRGTCEHWLWGYD